MTHRELTKRVTAADVARSLGLSRATVGFVLNNTAGQTISDATRRRVIAEAEKLGYRPHQAARALASGQSRIVLLVLPDWPIDHSIRVHLDEASIVLDRAGYSLVTTTPHADGHAPPLWETLNPDVVMGLLPFPAKTLAQMRRRGVRRIVPDAPASPAPAEGSGEFALGPRAQVEHLRDRGYRRLAFAGSPDPRLSGLVAERRALAHRSAELLPDVELVADADVSSETAEAALSRWIRDGIDGVVAYNDDIAALLVGTALRAGIEIPGQIAVVGHDDTPVASLFVPALSSVRIDSAGLGRYLAEVALAAIDGRPMPPAGEAGEATVMHRETT
jgi:DNA-binding LacI/PurR family transcriptional regulator